MKYKAKRNLSYCCNSLIYFYGDDLTGFCSKCDKEMYKHDIR